MEVLFKKPHGHKRPLCLVTLNKIFQCLVKISRERRCFCTVQQLEGYLSYAFWYV